MKKMVKVKSAADLKRGDVVRQEDEAGVYVVAESARGGAGAIVTKAMEVSCAAGWMVEREVSE